MVYDDTARLRMITLRFFERGIGGLALLRKDFDEFPTDHEARRRWVTEIREFADRAQGLADEWERRCPVDDMDRPSPKRESHAQIATPTPPV
jgi:hypothetical protein